MGPDDAVQIGSNAIKLTQIQIDALEPFDCRGSWVTSPAVCWPACAMGPDDALQIGSNAIKINQIQIDAL